MTVAAINGKVYVPSVDEHGALNGALLMTPSQAFEFAEEIRNAAAQAVIQGGEDDG